MDYVNVIQMAGTMIRFQMNANKMLVMNLVQTVISIDSIHSILKILTLQFNFGQIISMKSQKVHKMLSNNLNLFSFVSMTLFV